MSSSVSLEATPCSYCAGYHSGTCPRIKSIEYNNDGTRKRVEFHDTVSADLVGAVELQVDSIRKLTDSVRILNNRVERLERDRPTRSIG